jgi:arsenate reductase (glutaredoxin)
MKKIFCLSTCSTCDRILKEIDAKNLGFELQDIKTDKITAGQIDRLKKMAGSYEALFSRKAVKYRELKLKDRNLQEKDYRQLILEEYTFLKRPVVVLNNKIFVGSEKKTIEELSAILNA